MEKDRGNKVNSQKWVWPPKRAHVNVAWGPAKTLNGRERKVKGTWVAHVEVGCGERGRGGGHVTKARQ